MSAGSPTAPTSLVTFARVSLFVLAVAILWVARDIIIPAAIAILVAFVLTPLVVRFERLGVPRWVAVPTTVAATACIGLLVGWVVLVQSLELADDLPMYRTKVQAKVLSLVDQTEGLLSRARRGLLEVERQVNEAATAFEEPSADPQNDISPSNQVVSAPLSPSRTDALFGAVGFVAGAAISPLVMMSVVLLLATVIMLRREELRDRVLALAGHEQLHRTTAMMDEAARQLGRLLLTQLLVSIGFAVLFTTVMLILGVPGAILFGALVIPLRFVPVIGTWMSLAMPALLAIVVLDGWMPTLIVAGSFVAIELVASYIVEPWALGKRSGMSMTAVIVALIFWTWLWGAAGLILAMPITTSLAVLGRRVRGLEWIATLLNEDTGLPPSARLYQRLLALDLDQAMAIAHEARDGVPLEQTYATVLMPALIALERDRHSGELNDERAKFAIEGMAEIAEALALDQVAVVDAERRTSQRQIVLVPAHGEADAVAARMLMHVMQTRGQESHAVPIGNLIAERVTVAASYNADTVCICAMAPLAEAHARLVLQRMRGVIPEDRLVVALWQPNLEARNRERLEASGAQRIVITFDDAVRTLDG